MSNNTNPYAGINATYIRSLLLSAGFSNADLPPKPLVLVQKFEDYLQSYDWDIEWYDNIDPTKLNDKLLSLYDELSDVRDMKLEDATFSDDMMTTLSLQFEAEAECEAYTELKEFNYVDENESIILNDDGFTTIDIEVVEPIVHHDIKLDDVELPVEVITPQEVVSEPQEDLSTTTNEDTVMNTSILIPNWEVSGYVSLLDLDFGAYVVVESELTVELNGQCSELTCDVLNGQFTELAYPLMSPLTCDVLSGQCCDLVDAPKVETKLTPDELADVRASVQRACAKMERRSAYGSPVRHGATVTTKSGKTVKVSPHALQPYGGSPEVNHITNNKVKGSIGEASAVAPTQLNIFETPEYSIKVTNCKVELLDADSFDDIIIITRKYNSVNKQIVLDAKGQMTKRELSYIEGLKKAYRIIKESETVKTKATPVVSTPTPTPITHNAMMTAIRRMNGGRIPNAPVLNKLVTGYVTRNNSIISAVSKYIAPELLDMAEKAYAQLTA